MNRFLKVRTLPALAVALLLPISALAAPGTAASAAKSSAASKSTMHSDTATPSKAPHKTHGASKSHKSAMVDINSASKEELMTLPGVTDPTADKIIAGRPFKTKAELVAKQVLTRAEYGKLRGRVIAKQAPEAKAMENAAPESKSPGTTTPESK
jgi:competence protein ComEA